MSVCLTASCRKLASPFCTILLLSGSPSQLATKKLSNDQNLNIVTISSTQLCQGWPTMGGQTHPLGHRRHTIALAPVNTNLNMTLLCSPHQTKPNQTSPSCPLNSCTGANPLSLTISHHSLPWVTSSIFIPVQKLTFKDVHPLSHPFWQQTWQPKRTALDPRSQKNHLGVGEQSSIHFAQ